jgi:hypothetical protein
MTDSTTHLKLKNLFLKPGMRIQIRIYFKCFRETGYAHNEGVEAQNEPMEGVKTSGRRFPSLSQVTGSGSGSALEVESWIQICINVKEVQYLNPDTYGIELPECGSATLTTKLKMLKFEMEVELNEERQSIRYNKHN